jgi:hypothetical protein
MSKQWIAESLVEVYKYDYDVHGGAISTIVLADLPTNFVITGMDLVVDTTLTAGGAATIVIGQDGGGDADGYFLNVFATPTAGAHCNAGGALLAAGITSKVALATNGLAMTIGAFALTAGAFRIFVRGFQS